jgi:hypothetical protein
MSGYLDWNNDGVFTPGFLSLDANFNGEIDPAYVGSDDWSRLDLQQIGARRNAGGLSADISREDLAVGDIASGDIASGDIASGDIASGDIASGDIASGDIASGVQDRMDVDFETYNSTVEPPKALVVTSGKTSIVLTWTASPSDLIREYRVYRAVGKITETNAPVLLAVVKGKVANTPPPTTYTDTTAKSSTTYTYFITAVNSTGAQSTPSNTQTGKKQ